MGFDWATQSHKLRLEDRAIDTVTNFTRSGTLLANRSDGLQRPTSITILTSDYHATRAQAVARIVLWYLGISFRFLTIHKQEHVLDEPSGVHVTPPGTWRQRQAAEGAWRTTRDICRALLWVLTGGRFDGSAVSGWFHPDRVTATSRL